LFSCFHVLFFPHFILGMVRAGRWGFCYITPILLCFSTFYDFLRVFVRVYDKIFYSEMHREMGRGGGEEEDTVVGGNRDLNSYAFISWVICLIVFPFPFLIWVPFFFFSFFPSLIYS
jgi:hypothetical protein